MIRKIAIFFSAVFALPLSSHALVGGPFDGGDYGPSLDDQGVYQYAMRFKNGSGIAQFGSNVDPVPAVNNNAGSGTQSALKLGTNLDRALVYYKGVTYFGNCSGMVDTGRKKISAITNGLSDVTATSSANAGGNGNATITATSFIVSNGGNFIPLNTEFEGKIYTMKPILKFRGEGELTVLNPSISDALYSAIANTVAAIPTVAASGNSTVSATVTALQTFIASIPTILASASSLTSADATYQTSDHVHMTVFGSRRFFISQR